MCFLSEKARIQTAYISMMFQMCGVVMGVVVIWGGVHVKLIFQAFHELKQDHLGDSFPNFLIISGVLLAVLHLIGFQESLTLTDWKRYRRNKSIHQMLNFMYMVGNLLFIIVLIIIGSLLINYRYNLRAAWNRIMTDALKGYANDMNTKMLVDKIQVLFRCCGAASSSDWHKIPWMRQIWFPDTVHGEDYLKNTYNGFFVGTAVPFSCCNPRSRRPCIKIFYTESSKHHNYHPQNDITINTNGCADAVSKTVSYWLVILGEVCLWFTLAEAVALLVFRLVQTSSDLALAWGDPTQTAQAYVFICGVPPVPPGAELDPQRLAAKIKKLENLAFEDSIPETAIVDDDDDDDDGDNDDDSDHTDKNTSSNSAFPKFLYRSNNAQRIFVENFKLNDRKLRPVSVATTFIEGSSSSPPCLSDENPHEFCCALMSRARKRPQSGVGFEKYFEQYRRKVNRSKNYSELSGLLYTLASQKEMRVIEVGDEGLNLVLCGRDIMVVNIFIRGSDDESLSS